MLSKHSRTFFLIGFISFLQIVPVRSQTPSYYHYSTSDGLASSTVFEIIQTRDGFIWFATLNGASRFDGTHFTTLRTKDGLNSNATISLVEGTNGELYIGTYERGVNVLRNGRIENYCSEIDGKSFATSYLLLIHSGKDKQTLYAYRKAGAINVLTETTEGGTFHYSVSVYPAYVNKLERLPDGNVVALSPAGLFNLNNGALSKLHIDGLPDASVYCLTSGDDGSYFIGAKGMIYKIKDNKLIRRYEIPHSVDNGENNEPVEMLRDRADNLWFSVLKKGFYLIPSGSNDIIDIGSRLGLQNTLVNNFLEDNEGNIWISTYGKGVYCLNNLYLKSYSEHDGLSSNSVYAIAKDRSGGLLIGTFAGLNILEKGRISRIKRNSSQMVTDNIFAIKTIGDDVYVCGSFGGNGIESISYKELKLHLFVRSSFCKTRDGLYLFGNWLNSMSVQRGFNFEKKGLSLIYVLGDSSNINRVNDIVEDTKRNIWIGTSLGLCKLSGLSDKAGRSDWKKTFFRDDPVLNSKVVSVIQVDDNDIWFAGDRGIAHYNLGNDSVASYTTVAGYDLSSSTSLASDSRNRIWIGNMKGLYLLDGRSVKHLNVQTGLPSDEVYSLLYDRGSNTLYAGTSNGISALDITSFDNEVPPPIDVKIISVSAGDSVYTNYERLLFEPEQHNVYIQFKALSYSSPGSVRYRYNLNGEWAETDHDFLDFISLENGKYDLQILAKSQNSDWGKPYNLTFTVKPRFNETIWYKLGILTILVIVSGSVVAWRLKMKNKQIQKELELTERINELKHQALSAMMNPHFIFNSLNSVQYLINCQRNEEANDYIAMMAKLIRKNLDTAGSGFILLSEEIDRLKLYLDLEKLRFQERFSYEIIAGNDLEIGSIMIPNMIIQPFVENTLWHGIINSGSEGLITVSFSFQDVDIDSVLCKSLIIKVTDNGIGLEEAKKNTKEDHTSKGIEIIEERLKLLSTKLQLPQPIVFEDLSSRSTDSHGTEVIISLPPPLYRIIIPASAAESRSPAV